MSEWTLEGAQTWFVCFFASRKGSLILGAAPSVKIPLHILVFLKRSTNFSVCGFPVAAPNVRLPFNPPGKKLNPGHEPRGPRPC